MSAKSFVVAIVILTATSLVPAHAESLQGIVDSCQDQNTYAQGYCVGFLNAVSSIVANSNIGKDKAICLDDVTNQDMIDAVITTKPAISPPPDQQHAIPAVIEVFKKAFPCDQAARAAVTAEKKTRIRRDFLSRCAKLDAAPTTSVRQSCSCLIEKIEPALSVDSPQFRQDAEFLLTAPPEALSKVISAYRKTRSTTNDLVLASVFVEALAACFK